MTIEQLRECFDSIQPRPNGKAGFIADCPICRERLIAAEFRGMIMLRCSAGCPEADIRHRLGLVLGDLFDGRDAGINVFFARSMGIRNRASGGSRNDDTGNFDAV